MKEKIIFKCYSGSMLYGTNSEKSDIDIKGIFLPDLEDLVLGKAPKCYQQSTGKKDEKNSKDDIDETYYSLQYFLELLEKGDTNALDMLFAFTNKNAVIYCNSLFKKIIFYKDKFLTKNTRAYLGYCKNQAYKYSFKGDKINDFKRLKEFCIKYIREKKENHLSLKEALLKEINFKSIKDDSLKNFLITNSNGILHLDEKLFNSNNYYIITEKNKERYLMVHDVKFDFESPLNYLIHKIDNVLKSYGKRAKNAAENNGIDNKAISHCIRVLFQVEELLLEHTINFPLKQAEFVKSVKYSTSNFSRDEIMEWIEDKIKLIETVEIPISTLREKSDHEFAKKIILYAYGLAHDI